MVAQTEAEDPVIPLVFSADNHFEEPEDALAELIPESLRTSGPRVTEEDGEILRLIPGLSPVNIAISEAHRMTVNDEMRRREFRDDPTGGRVATSRIAVQEADGIGAEVIYPNKLLTLTANPDARYQAAMVDAYISIAAELFGEYPDRFAVAIPLPLGDIDASVDVVLRVAASGFRCVVLPPTIPWMPYFLSDYEPLWNALEETGLVANFHSFGGNVAFGADFANVWVIPPDLLAAGQAALRRDRWLIDGHQVTAFGLPHMVMTMASGMSPILHLTSAGVLERHPGLRFAIVESEAGWLPFVLDMMDHLQDRRPEVRALTLRASDYFRRQGAITFSTDPTSLALVERIGEDNLMWGSDYPHDEGTFPDSRSVLARTFTRVDSAISKKILWSNAARLYGFPAEPPTPMFQRV